jgi:hypothetical protein
MKILNAIEVADWVRDELLNPAREFPHRRDCDAAPGRRHMGGPQAAQGGHRGPVAWPVRRLPIALASCIHTDVRMFPVRPPSPLAPDE